MANSEVAEWVGGWRIKSKLWFAQQSKQDLCDAHQYGSRNKFSPTRMCWHADKIGMFEKRQNNARVILRLGCWSNLVDTNTC